MSVLRRVKLRTPDGTESIEYPLGVDAENVEVANGENLSQRLARIDEDLENNEEDIATVGELAGTNKQNIGANEIRIDALERRSAAVDKKPYYFDTVADMKADTKLKAGDMVITLGYYEPNDGGNGTYFIREKESNEVANDGSTHEISNGLIAQLLNIDNTISPQQFGAYGDGEHDDTTAIKNTINYVNQIIIKNNTFSRNEPTIEFKGRYKVSSQIVLPPYIKYRCSGNVLILSTVTDTSTLKFSYDLDHPDLVNNEFNANQYLHGQLIYGDALRILSLNKNQGTAIELGNSTNPNDEKYCISRTKLSNISIQNFDCGILINCYNFYIFNFDNIKLHHNNIHIKFGSSVYANDNSGEKITFYECMLGTSYQQAIEINVASLDLRFISCSFDFNRNGICCLNRSSNISLFDCHIEGIIINRSMGAKGMFWISSSSTAEALDIKIENTTIVISKQYMPIAYCDNGFYIYASMNNNSFIYNDSAKEKNLADNIYLFDGSNRSRIIVNFNNTNSTTNQSISYYNDINSEGYFEDINNDTAINTSSYFDSISAKNFKADSTIKTVDEKKYLNIATADSPSSDNAYIILSRNEYIPIEENKQILGNAIYRINAIKNTEYPKLQFNMIATFYDENKGQIGDQKTYAGNINDTATNELSKEYKFIRNTIITIPENKRIKYCKIKYQLFCYGVNNISNVLLRGISLHR